MPCVYDTLYNCDKTHTIAQQNGQYYIITLVQTPEVGVVLNGNRLSFDNPPQIIDGRTVVPLRTIFEAMQATVNWEGETQTVDVSRGNDEISFQIGNNVMTKNGQTISIDVAPQLINNSTFVPLRAISEAFSFDVSWDGEAYDVIITE